MADVRHIAAPRGSEQRRAILSFVAVSVLAVGTMAGGLSAYSARSAGYSSVPLLSMLPALLIAWAAIFDEIRRRPYSLHLLHLIGVYVLLVVSPLFQLSLGYLPTSTGIRPEVRHVLWTNVAVLLWLIGYLAGYYWFHASARRRQRKHTGRGLQRGVSPGRIVFALVLTFPVLAYLVYLGLGGVVTRKTATASLQVLGSGPSVLLVGVFVRAFPIVALGAGILLLRRRGLRRAPMLAALVFAVLLGVLYADNPLAAGRYWQVAVLIGFVAPHLLRGRKTGVLLLVASMIGLTVLPALGGGVRQARSGSDLLDALEIENLASPVSYLATSGDVAAYGVLYMGSRWVDRNGHTWGRQTLGALLFWFPRALWRDKPISTGTMITEDFGFDFTIVSAPIVTEPLLDFGLLGVPLFAVLIAAILAYLDAAYHAADADPGRIRVIDTFYPFMLGLMLLVVRGSMMSAVAFTAGFVASTLPLVLRLPLPSSAGATRRQSRVFGAGHRRAGP